MTTIKDIVQNSRVSMEKGVEASKRDFAGIRSGKASPQMLDTVRVEMYGQSMTLNQGGVIRVPLPSMNEQRRKELVKVVHKLAEEGRVVIRHARTDARDRLKKIEGVSEDDKKHAEKDLQKLHDDFIARIEAMVKAKEAEIMEV
jgi:ribosome recycling factor